MQGPQRDAVDQNPAVAGLGERDLWGSAVGGEHQRLAQIRYGLLRDAGHHGEVERLAGNVEAGVGLRASLDGGGVDQAQTSGGVDAGVRGRVNDERRSDRVDRNDGRNIGVNGDSHPLGGNQRKHAVELKGQLAWIGGAPAGQHESGRDQAHGEDRGGAGRQLP
jgi:hypothetical protein